jgi:hypothetical protein
VDSKKTVVDIDARGVGKARISSGRLRVGTLILGQSAINGYKARYFWGRTKASTARGAGVIQRPLEPEQERCN